jgi:CHAT domain-containing protein/Tfp pilus assembly protein PilF
LEGFYNSILKLLVNALVLEKISYKILDHLILIKGDARIWNGRGNRTFRGQGFTRQVLPGGLAIRKQNLIVLLLVFIALGGHAAPGLCPAGDLNEAQVLDSKVVQLYYAGRYQEALPLAQRALQIKEKARGPEHPDTAFSLSNLARLHKVMGAYDKALPLYQRALKIQENTLGPENALTVDTLYHLAELYRTKGAYVQALPLYQRGLKIREKASGPENPDTALSRLQLAELYNDMGAYAKALPLYQRALQITEKAMGPEHFTTRVALNNLALLYRNMGAYAQALPLYQRNLKIDQRTLGPEHPETGTSLNNLSLIYYYLGAYAQALPLAQRSLKIFEKARGPEHPDTANSLTSLALIYQATGAYAQALPLAQRALKIQEKALGPEHPETATALHILAALHRDMGAYVQALPLDHRALTIREKALGPEHLYTAYSLNNLAMLYLDTGAYDQALPLAQRALKIFKKARGPARPETATSLGNLAGLYATIGAHDTALPLLQRALKIKEEARGPEHPDTATGLANLAWLYRRMGAYDQALPLAKRALKIREKSLGPGHPDTLFSLANLGFMYMDRKDYQAAEAYFRRARNQGGLAELALAQGRPGEALKLLQDQSLICRYCPTNQVEYYTRRGLALAGVGRSGEAALALRQAVAAAEELRQRAPGERTGFFKAGGYGGYVRPYRGLVSVLAEMSRKQEELPPALKEYGPGAGEAAFYFAEATRGRVLLESMARAARKTTQVELPRELGQREMSLHHQLSALEAQWEKALAGGEEALKEVRARKEKLSAELQALIRELRQKYPLYAALHYPQPLPARDLPLKENEVLLEYALGDQAGYLFVVRKGGVRKLIKIPLGREGLEAKVRAFMAPLINKDQAGFSLKQGRELYDLLLAEALAEVQESDQVIIVPDGILGLLPFEALVIKEGAGVQESVYVGDRYSLSYYQSATVLALQRRLQEHQAKRALFALGNPVFSDRDARYLAYKQKARPPIMLAQAPEQVAFRALATRREWGKTTQDEEAGQELVYPPLYETETEVMTIARILGVEPKPPDVLLNVQANETSLRKSPLKDYRYLHFATHADLPGKVQGKNEPFILLGQVENKKGDDGFLTLSEVLGLKLNAEMVVLSACLTGRGQVMEGEGVANFARAFQYAGARSVVVSLWEVASQETVEYMVAFYGHLKNGKSRAQALKLARQEIKAKYPHPFYWAPFVLHGEG